MSRLYEYQGKELLRREGFFTPEGIIAGTVDEVKQAVTQITPPIVLKTQVLQTGRGKAGGIRLCDNAGQAMDASKELFGGSLKGDTVRSLLVEKKVEFDQEFFVGITLDDQAKAPVLMISAEGGVDIEETAAKNPAAIGRIDIDYLNGLQLDDAVAAVAAVALPPGAKDPLAMMLVRLIDMSRQY
ncbi:MAG: ATP-grasp domain-containing protein, partial [bacterium]